MYTGIHHLHSALRYVVLFLLLIAFVKALSGWLGKKEFTSTDNKLSLFAMVFCHIQLLVGLMMYFMSDIVKIGWSDIGSAMHDPQVRFYTMEHGLMMIFAIAFVTIGRISSKKQVNSEGKFKKVAIFFGLGLLIIFAMIPWPFMKDFGTWF